MSDLEVKVMDVEKKNMLKFLEANHDSGELHCPATSSDFVGFVQLSFK